VFEAPGQRTVLVVDDEAPIRDMLTQFLPTRGFRVLTAQDGLAALAVAESERPPHLIVLDIHMPGMNGVEVLRKLRAKNYKGVIMMLTGSLSSKLLKEALDLGAVDIVGKPFDPEHLALAIQASMVLAGH
jgi:DNA-binding response OmpR family regulator